MRRLSVLSPRRVDRPLEDWGERPALVSRQRIDRRRRLVRRVRSLARTTMVLAAVAAGLGAAGLGVRWLLTSPRFAVAAVEVRGTSRLDAAEVVAASRIRQGQNLWRLDARAAAAGVESLPAVRRAEVVRDFPNRVTIVVEERRPFTLVHAGRLHWIDEEGVRVASEGRAVTVALPVISGLTDEEIAAASRAPSERVLTGVRLIRTLLRAGSPLVAQISEVDVGRSDGPVLYTVDGIEVRLGAEEWDSRIPRLAGVLAQVASSGQPVSAIDLRFRDQVVLKPAVR
ncbi:MAG TPA: FtsQ-type POTRA domain-containing protein [Methylomirabilota bacterium]|nr:FtsQ-type POTRA domain-containing protein [Methylomirabilota bacterium]